MPVTEIKLPILTAANLDWGLVAFLLRSLKGTVVEIAERRMVRCS